MNKICLRLLGQKLYQDLFHWANGSPVVCPSCLSEKKSDDPAIPGETRWRFWHGRPSEPGSHSRQCGYCDTGWKKKKPEMTQEEYVTWANTDEGKAAVTGWSNSIVEIRIEKGPNPRLSKKQIASWDSAPVQLKRQTADETETIEPDEEFVLASDYLADNKKDPATDGIECEWVTRRNGERQYGFLKTTDAPLRRRHKKRESLQLDEVLDNGEMQLSEDQVPSSRY